jgi:predicted aspartyl protease
MLATMARHAVAVAISASLFAPAYAEPVTGTANVTDTLARFAIDLPWSVTATPAVRGPLEELGREKCDQDAILHLGTALDQAGYRREAAVAQVNFSGQCGGYVPALRGAANILLKLSDFTTAEAIATNLIKLEPFDDNGYFLRAVARDGSKSFKGAIDDYVTAIEMFGNKDRISSIGYYNMARAYEKLGQFCDAMLPIKQWIALDPARHDTSQTHAILADYAAKGGCAAATSGGVETFPVARPHNLIKVPVIVNDVSSTLALDTGATFVTLTESFAKKANVEVDQSSVVHLHTANGIVEGKRGRADTMQLRSLKTRAVPIVVESDSAAGYARDGLDGLLGLSFLSRFNVTIDARTVRIATSTRR